MHDYKKSDSPVWFSITETHQNFGRPKAKEAIKYDIPTFTLKGNLVSFAAWKKHIGFYPAPREVEEFKEELASYHGNKSTVKFFFDKPLPLALISRMVKFKVKKQSEHSKKK